MKVLAKVAAGFVALLLVVTAVGYAVLQRPDIPYETLEARYVVPTSHFVDLPSGVRAHYRDDGVIGPRRTYAFDHAANALDLAATGGASTIDQLPNCEAEFAKADSIRRRRPVKSSCDC